MKQTILKSIHIAAIFIVMFSLYGCGSTAETQKISVPEYKSKMKAAWLGQMAGVGWGAPTEFVFTGEMIPEEKVPTWDQSMINQQWQDDIYVEMTFLKTLEDYGFDVSIRQAGIDFANSEYMLWGANEMGRGNLRQGIAPPYSGARHAANRSGIGRNIRAPDELR